VRAPRVREAGRRAGFSAPPNWTDAEEAEYTALRSASSKNETPVVMVWIAILVMVISTANYITRPDYHPGFHVIDFAAALTMLGFAMWLRGPAVSAKAVQWSFVGCTVLMLYSLIVQAWLAPDAGIAYVLILMSLYGPLVLAWRPFLVGSVLMVAGVTAVAATFVESVVADWALLSTSAVMGSAVLLQIRLRAMQAQARAMVRANDAAIEDLLTGLLNRRGLAHFLPGFAATARRLHQPIRVYFVDVDSLKPANDAFGHAFGDRVLVHVAGVVRSTVREGDLVCRWGGDEFVIVGMGTEATADDFEGRLQRGLRSDGPELDGWVRTVSVGRAFGSLEVATVEDLISRADAAMYARRAERQSGASTAGSAPQGAGLP
jgi:diguanylate cyclase (GGDEF)-like protein